MSNNPKKEKLQELMDKDASVDQDSMLKLIAEEGDDVFQSPTDEDCEDWSELIAIAKALKMSGSSIRALEEKSSESGCKEVIDETDGEPGITVEVMSGEDNY